MTLHRTLAAALLLGAGLTLLSSCCMLCGDDDAKPLRCTAKLKYTDGKFSKSNPFLAESRGVDKSAARKHVCEDYCYSADPRYDAKFKGWVHKPENKNERARYDKDPRHSKEWGAMGNSSIKRELTLCVDQCVDAGKNKRKTRLTISTHCDPKKKEK